MLAVALARHPKGPDRERAIAAIDSALKKLQAPDADLWMLLVELREPQDDPGEAVRILERATRQIPEDGALEWMLERYRKRVLPLLASYASVDAALEDLDRIPLVGEEATWRYFHGSAGEPSDEPLA